MSATLVSRNERTRRHRVYRGCGPAPIDELEKNWLTACDPRLNRGQAIDLAAHVAALIE